MHAAAIIKRCSKFIQTDGSTLSKRVLQNGAWAFRKGRSEVVLCVVDLYHNYSKVQKMHALLHDQNLFQNLPFSAYKLLAWRSCLLSPEVKGMWKW